MYHARPLADEEKASEERKHAEDYQNDFHRAVLNDLQQVGNADGSKGWKVAVGRVG